MNETLIVGALLLVLLGAVSFYLYSRIIYNERKMGLIESILLDIKMNMEMEEERHGHQHMPPAPTPESKPMMVEAVEAEEMEEELYKDVLESAQPAAEAVEAPATLEPVKSYEEYTRDEVAAIAEKRGLRVTKRSTKSAIIALLQESDKSQPGQVADEPVGSGNNLQGSSDGAPLESVTLEELP